jgi:hypothetical protein
MTVRNTLGKKSRGQLKTGFLFFALIPSLASTQSKPTTQTNDRALVQKMLEDADVVQKQVAKLRGREFKKDVKKAVRTEKQLRAYLKKEIFEEELGHGKLERNEWILQTIGLIPKKMNLGKTILDVLLNQVGGFYDPKQDSFFMMTKMGKMGGYLNRITISHELTHALDDQYHDLEKIMKSTAKTEDGDFAIGAVIEGSATALMTRWSIKNPPTDRKQMLTQMKAEAERSKAFFETPAYFWTLAAKYVMGMRFLAGGGSMIQIGKKLLSVPEGMGKRVDQALANPPLSSEQILHPEKYWDPNKLDLPITISNETEVESTILDAMGGGQILERETMGEILCAILTRPQTKKLNPSLMNAASFWTNRAARGWGGDRLFMLKNSKGKKGILWITLWDLPKDAEEFASAYKKHHSKVREFGIAKQGRIVTITFGCAQGLENALLERVAKKGKFVKGKKQIEAIEN